LFAWTFAFLTSSPAASLQVAKFVQTSDLEGRTNSCRILIAWIPLMKK